jgi:hypothetical protein
MNLEIADKGDRVQPWSYGCASLQLAVPSRSAWPGRRWRRKVHPAEGKLAAQDEVTIYRGVHCQHPVLPEALAGRAVPGNVNGAVTPEQHNDGGYSDQSPYTAWTIRKEVADYYARRRSGGHGVILTRTVPRLELIPSPDRMSEGEVFLRGEVAGIGPLR